MLPGTTLDDGSCVEHEAASDSSQTSSRFHFTAFRRSTTSSRRPRANGGEVRSHASADGTKTMSGPSAMTSTSKDRTLPPSRYVTNRYHIRADHDRTLAFPAGVALRVPVDCADLVRNPPNTWRLLGRHIELRSMRLAISRRIDRALNFSALWIGCTGIEWSPMPGPAHTKCLI